MRSGKCRAKTDSPSKSPKSASVPSSPDIAYNRRKSVTACARQDLPPDRIGEEEDDQISVTPLPNFCGTFEVTIK